MKAKTNARERSTQGATKRHWFRVGPGLLLAVAASYFVWRQTAPSPAPRIEHAPLVAAPTIGLSAPEPAWLLAQRDALKMSAQQFQKLSRLRTRWQHDTRDLQSALDRASADFNHDLAQGGGKTVTIPQIQERAASVSELSRQLSQARRAWWDEAAQVLSREQRRRAEENWARRFMNNHADAEPPRKTRSN